MSESTHKFSFEERISYLKEYGSHCMSFSGFQPGIQYFDMPGIGYIAYEQKWGRRAVLSDPVCHIKDQELLIREFLKEGEPTGFAQVSEPVAILLYGKFGFYATQFGIESIIDLKNWDLKGKKKQILRTSLNQATKSGVCIYENNNKNGYNQFSEEWIKTRKVKSREIRFLIRPMNMDYEEGTRKFFAYQEDKLLGLIFFDPIYSNGQIISYVPNISRFKREFRQGIFYAIMMHAMDIFKKEGIEQIHLGLSAFAVSDTNSYYEADIPKKIVRFLYQHGNRIYSFKGIYFTKSRFKGKEYRTFCSHKGKLPFREIITLFKLSNFF
jgi:phosphatidylglycerol lysyltransferase